MALRVYNTLTRQKEAFQTVQPGKVGMYVCGPTVYKPSHIGHMVGPVIFDTVRRYLTYLGYEVSFVVNITDVDDKLIKRAQESGTTVKALAEQMTADYLDCLKRLGVEGITHLPKATEHIEDMVRLIQGLIDKGHAYAAAGDVYFDVTSDPDYGKLCHRDPEQMEAGARIEVSEKKRCPGDFALWKGAKPGEPAWDSPWGPGRPGWHIECSAMSMRYLGQTLDIHGGGDDLKFPHHENELAQSESFTGRPFVRYWMHNGLLKMGTTKMAGSVGNVVNMVDVLKQFDAETVRFLLLSTHYRSPIEYSEERLAETRKAIDSFYRFFERYQRVTGASFYQVQAPTRRGEFTGTGDFLTEVAELRTRFLDCMDDDFNTGGAVGVLYELLTAINRFVDAQQLEGGKADPAKKEEFGRAGIVFRELGQLLGLFREAPPLSFTIRHRRPTGAQQVPPAAMQRPLTTGRRPVPRPNDPPSTETSGREEFITGVKQLYQDLGHEPPQGSSADDAVVKEWLDRLVELRTQARNAKNFAVADQIRQGLGQLGVTLEDRPGGTGWRRG